MAGKLERIFEYRVLLAKQGQAELALQVRQEFDRREVPQQWRDRLETTCRKFGETQEP